MAKQAPKTAQDFTPLFAALKEFAPKIQRELTVFYAEKSAEAKATDPKIHEMVTLLQEFMLRRGKAVRPFVAWCAYKLAGGTNDSAMLKVSTAIEMNHYFLLALDDMADRDTIRHGAPTLEVSYQQRLKNVPPDKMPHMARSLTEIATALLHTEIYEMFVSSGFPAERILEASHVFAKRLIENTAAGWLIHWFQNSEKFAETSEERFIKGLRYVTADYGFVGPLTIGLTMANKHPEFTVALESYGRDVGTAFQIHDDILGLFGNPDDTGKSAGNDVREGKKTLLLQHAYAKGTDEERAFLENVTGTDLSQKELDRVREIVTKTGSLNYSQALAKKLVGSGKKALLEIRTSENKKHVDLLLLLADYVIVREK